ncbi:ABC-three component system protein [Amphibacillus indicireducens]|uniref:ABC-three component systems C-terminal domain-containing protein n=1 Tax=Amphibacillus indicireducens TaxID=1076330 RepID=A0ABP7VKB9_9BACI
MNLQERGILRVMLQNKLFKSDGQSFEDLFVSIMNYVDNDFQSIKPWGNIGDRKNDGYIKRTNTYYQVYAPEEIEKAYMQSIKKLATDFDGLMQQWSPVNCFYFVLNDKYKGIHPDLMPEIQKIKDKHHLESAGIITAKDIENMLFTLKDDQIISIVGIPPDPSNIKNIDYSALNEVITYIMELPIQTKLDDDLVLPDWDEKIQFNGLSQIIADFLNTASYQLHNLQTYLSNNGHFVADELKIRVNEVYQQEKSTKNGDQLFMAMVEQLSPKQTQSYQNTVIIIMAKYFETCDIFEEPKKEENA